MTRRILKFALAGLLIAMVLTVAAAGWLVWRVSQGPVSLAFMAGTIGERINATLHGLEVRLDDVVVERSEETGRPTFRLRDVTLLDEAGGLIARAPRAAIAFDGAAMMTGSIKPVRLQLIGPRILARRETDGSLELGFGEVAQAAPAAVEAAAPDTGGKSDASVPTAPTAATTGETVFETLTRLLEGGGVDAAVSSMESVEITQAHISFRDEVQNTLWVAPRANLAFRRAPEGFALRLDAEVATGSTPWRIDIAAVYRSASDGFTVNARIFDVVPALVAERMFALTQFADVLLPLSGRIDLEVSRTGTVSQAAAELAVASGTVRFPGYISDALKIDSGLIRIAYVPDTGHYEIGESALSINGVQASFAGRVEPQSSTGQKIDSVRFRLDARNLNIDISSDAQKAVALDRVEMTGQASFTEARLDVDDLVLMQGDGGLRLRGYFVGGDDAVGVFLGGRARDLTYDMLRRIWPPFVAPLARQWVRENIRSGVIRDGELRVALSPETLAAALKGVAIPDNLVDLRFTVDGITATYADGLPPIEAAAGSAALTGDRFSITADRGQMKLPSGQTLALRAATMDITKLALPISPGVLNLEAAGSVAGFIEYADLEPLSLVRGSGFEADKVSGDGTVKLRLAMPLGEGLTASDIAVTATAHVPNAAHKEIVAGFAMDKGDLRLELTEDRLTAVGPALINGQKAKLEWTRMLAKGGSRDDTIALETTLSDADRQKMGFDLSSFLAGPTPVKLAASRSGTEIKAATVEADLTKTELRLDALSWTKPSGAKARAVFAVDTGAENAVTIKDIRISGSGIDIRGRLRLGHNGDVLDGSFPSFVLNEQNQLALEIDNKSGVLGLGVGGASLDARPLINQMFSAASGGGSGDPPVNVNLNIGRIYANRGEVVNAVSGRLQTAGGVVQNAEITGSFINGAPIVIRITPGDNGTRNMRVTGRDGGAALRASNLYSKVAGGTLDFGAILGPRPQGGIQRGLLVIRNFEVRNESALTEIDRTSRAAGKQTGPRRDGLRFSKLTLPFSTDNRFVRIGDALIQGPDMGASAQGIIRKGDGALDIGGTIIPAYALNSAISGVPVLGQVLTGGRGQGVFGINFALQGTMGDPRFLVNPVSAIAPGFLRQLFNIGGGGTNPDGTASQPVQRQQPAANR